MKKYKKILKENVFSLLVSIGADPMNPIGAISISAMVDYLETSRYQVKKHINQLKGEGLIELKCFDINSYDDESEYSPPYWGYQLTEKGRQTPEYEKQSKESIRLLKECFGE